jgi:hypothetical protein
MVSQCDGAGFDEKAVSSGVFIKDFMSLRTKKIGIIEWSLLNIHLLSFHNVEPKLICSW